MEYGLKRVDDEIIDVPYIKWDNEVVRKFDFGISQNIKLDNNFCELIGIWLAEGSINSKSISFTIHKEEKDFKERIIELMWKVFQLDNYTIYERKDCQAVHISYSCRQLVKFFEQLFGTKDYKDINQWNKYIPKILKKISPLKQLQIFKGWFIGDGYARREGRESKCTTVSKQLCYDMVDILNRNCINPYVTSEKREGKKESYNIMIYSHKAEKLYEMKYHSNLKKELNFTLEDRTEMDIPVFWNGKVFIKTKLERDLNYIEEEKQDVYCLKVPSHNFTINGTIVHNCRGMEINNDVATYMSSLIPIDRGQPWSIEECYYGNPKEDKAPIKEFKNLVDQYDGLLDALLLCENLISGIGIHASGVIPTNKPVWECNNSVQKAVNGELITAYDLHQSEWSGFLLAH